MQPEDILSDQNSFSARAFNVLLNRILKNLYSTLDETEKARIEKVFSSGTDEEKDEFFKKYSKDIKKIFQEESEKLERDLQEEAIKQKQ